jgi:Fe-S-cluster-containing dehydrogenase component
MAKKQIVEKQVEEEQPVEEEVPVEDEQPDEIPDEPAPAPIEVKPPEVKPPETKPPEAKPPEPPRITELPALDPSKKQQKILVVDYRRCVGCEICESVCSMSHDTEFNPINARINRVRIEPFINNAVNCLKCYKPYCVPSCQINALSKNPDTGIVHIDNNKCDGCAACIKACPYGAITLHSKKRKAIVCDFCESTPEKTPQCVEFCPKGAIFILPIDGNLNEERTQTLARMIKKGFPGDGMLN